MAGPPPVGDAVADTHALFWYLTADRKLGAGALAAFQAAESGHGVIYVPSLVVAELYYLLARLNRLAEFAGLYHPLAAAPHIRFVAFRGEDVEQFDSLNGIPEMHDRIIAGVARRLGVPCLTRDPLVINSGLVATVW